MDEGTILRLTREVIANNENWTQGSLARKQDGAPCKTDCDQATRFSLLGAIDRVISKCQQWGMESAVCEALGETLAWRWGYALPANVARRSIALSLVDAFNDLANHTAVIRLVDQTIDTISDLPR